MKQPKKYRKKPIVIEAIQYDGTEESYMAIKRFGGKAISNNVYRDRSSVKFAKAYIRGKK